MSPDPNQMAGYWENQVVPEGGNEPELLMAMPGAKNFVEGAKNQSPLQAFLGGLELAGSIYLIGDTLMAAFYGEEYKIGSNLRLAPWGNRTQHELGKFPHYHRRGIPGPDGKTPPGQGIGRHRPWETKVDDKAFRDRF